MMLAVYRIRVVDVLSPDLVLRANARRLVGLAESRPEDEIVLDFTGVETIGRSFAHEYVVRRDASRKRIREENLPENIRKMLEIVRNPPSKESWLPPIDDAAVLTL